MSGKHAENPAEIREFSHKIIASEAGCRLTAPILTGNVANVPSDRTRDRGAGYPEGGGCEASRSRQVEGSGRPVARGDQAEIPVIVRPLGTSFCPAPAGAVTSPAIKVTTRTRALSSRAPVILHGARCLTAGHTVRLTRSHPPHIVSSAVAIPVRRRYEAFQRD